MPLRIGPLLLFVLVFSCSCVAHPVSSPISPLPRRIAPPSPRRNQVSNGGFEKLTAGSPAGWKLAGSAGSASLRAVEAKGAPEGRRIAEISLPAGRAADEPPAFEQDLPLRFGTTYDLSAWVRGVDIISAVQSPLGFGRECGVFFQLYGPGQGADSAVFPSGAYPRRDGTTEWELRTMRFTTPPRDAFPGPQASGESGLRMRLRVQLHGTGTIQVDDLRLVESSASPPIARRAPGKLAYVQHSGKPFFGLGLYGLPEGTSWGEVAREGVFNFSGGADLREKRSLGLPGILGTNAVDPACTGCAGAARNDCAACLRCPESADRCGGYRRELLRESGSFLIWIDEPNGFPEDQGDLEEQIRSARRIHEGAATQRPDGGPIYIFSSDNPGGVYFNTYGWDELAGYHRSDAFDVVGVIRRGGNPKPGALGGVMSEYSQTSINGIRNEVRRLSDDVSEAGSRQAKPVWMLVNGGSGRIVTDPDDPAYPFAPHDAAELLAMRPSRDQLRYMLYEAVLNGATGLLFYQDENDTLLTAADPYWTQVMLPAAAELATLEKETGFLTHAEYNTGMHRLTGASDGIDSMLKQVGEGWILAVANSSPERAFGGEIVIEGGRGFEGPVERLVYRHDPSREKRRFEAVPVGKIGTNRIPLDLPGYGVALYRFRLSGGKLTSPYPGRN